MFAAAFFRRRNFHTYTSFASLFVLTAWVFRGFVMLVGAFFRTRYIHTPFCPVYLSLPRSVLASAVKVRLHRAFSLISARRLCHADEAITRPKQLSHGCHCPGDMAVRMRKVLTRSWVGVRVCHFLLLSFYCLYVLVSSLVCMVASRLWQFVTSRLGTSRPAPTWRLVSDRHETFSGVDKHYLKFTSAIPFRDMTSGVTIETVGDNSRQVVTTRWNVTIRREASHFFDPLRIGCIGHEWKQLNDDQLKNLNGKIIILMH